MALKLMEGILDALDTYLSAALPTKITEINTRNEDTILDDMAAIEPHEVYPIEKFPVLEMLGVKAVTLREMENYYQGLYTVNFRLTATAQNDAELIATKLYRYHLALVECLKEARSDAGFSSIIIQIGDCDFSDTFEGASDFIKQLQLECTFNRTEAK